MKDNLKIYVGTVWDQKNKAASMQNGYWSNNGRIEKIVVYP